MNAINRIRLAAVKILKHSLSKVKFRGKGTILSLLCPTNEIIKLDLFGYAFDCDLSEHIQRDVFLYGYDEEAHHFIERHLKKGDLFVDVGANVGFYSLLAASIVGETGRVIAIEPNPKTHAKLKQTIERNGIQNVLLLNLGLGREEGSLDLYTDPAGNNNDTASMVAKAGPNSVQVKVAPLDLIAQSNRLGQIDYLKIDVDGFEPEVLAGAKSLLQKKRIKFLQTEFSDYWLRRNGSSPQLLHDTLTSAGFEDVDGTPHFTPGCIIDRFFKQR